MESLVEAVEANALYPEGDERGWKEGMSEEKRRSLAVGTPLGRFRSVRFGSVPEATARH